MPINNSKKKEYVKYVKTQDLDAVYEDQRMSVINVVPQQINDDNDYLDLTQPTKSLLSQPPNKMTSKVLDLAQQLAGTESHDTFATRTPQFDKRGKENQASKKIHLSQSNNPSGRMQLQSNISLGCETFKAGDMSTVSKQESPHKL